MKYLSTASTYAFFTLLCASIAIVTFFFLVSFPLPYHLFHSIFSNEYSLSLNEDITKTLNYVKGSNINLSNTFTEIEIVHLQALRKLYLAFEQVTAGILFATILSSLFFVKSGSVYFKVFLGLFKYFYLLIFLFGLVTIVWFERVFLLFHLVVFSGDHWQLDPSKHLLIRLFPPEIFMFLGTIGVVFVFLAITLLYFVAKAILNKNNLL